MYVQTIYSSVDTLFQILQILQIHPATHALAVLSAYYLHRPLTRALTEPSPSLGKAKPRVWYTAISFCLVSNSSISKDVATLAIPR